MKTLWFPPTITVVCGIAGYTHEQWDEQNGLLWLADQLQAMAHRGPDGSGRLVVRQGKSGVGHVRLATIALGEGQQPLRSSDGCWLLACNGEIYNYLELRQSLCKLGRVFVTQSDTEVLLQGWEQWGEEVFSRLNGMFACAILNCATGEWVAARDPFGQKPFFYTHSQSQFRFASELTSGLSNAPASVSPAAQALFLACEGIPAPDTPVEGVKQLPPQHLLRFDPRQGLRVYPYHRATPEKGGSASHPLLSRKNAVADVEKSLLASVERTGRADVPVAILLSGGVDSSLLLALYRAVYPQRPLTTFHVTSAAHPSYDESERSRQVAKRFQTDHHEVRIRGEDYLPAVREMLSRTDVPLGDAGAVIRWLACRHIRLHAPVCLTGDGADELFYGYPTFLAERWWPSPRWLPLGGLTRLFSWVAANFSGGQTYLSPLFLLRQLLQGWPSEAEYRRHLWHTPFPPSELRQLFGDSYALRVQQVLERRMIGSPGDVPVGRLAKLAANYRVQYLPDYILVNSDRASMHCSVEMRAPYLDQELTQLVASLPDAHHLRFYTRKRLLKQIANRYLPREIVSGKKRGFTFPVASVLRRELWAEVQRALTNSGGQAGWDRDYVERLVSRFARGDSALYRKIWVLFSLQLWLETHSPTQSTT